MTTETLHAPRSLRPHQTYQPADSDHPVEMVTAEVGRTVEVWRAYRAYQQAHAGVCPFCADAHTSGNDLISVDGTMIVLRNLFPYAVWEGLEVLEHLMVVPVRHLLRFDEFTREEVLDHFEVTSRYEAEGYSVYTRAQANVTRSVAHLHTHLIRTRVAS